MVGMASHTSTSESGSTRVFDRPARQGPISAGPMRKASSNRELLYGAPRTTLQRVGSSSPERPPWAGPASKVSQNAGLSRPQVAEDPGVEDTPISGLEEAASGAGE